MGGINYCHPLFLTTRLGAKMKKILVAEDEKVMRYMIKDFLENYDFEVIQAENGLDAYVLWKNEKPDILLTDINMPKMNGIELLQRIKNTTPDFPVIVMTGVNIETSVNIANNNKANAILEKPFRMHDLVSIINKHLEL